MAKNALALYGQGYLPPVEPGSPFGQWDWQQPPVTTADIGNRMDYNSTAFGRAASVLDRAGETWQAIQARNPFNLMSYAPVRNVLGTVGEFADQHKANPGLAVANLPAALPMLDPVPMGLEAAKSTAHWGSAFGGHPEALEWGDMLTMPGALAAPQVAAATMGMVPKNSLGIFGGRLAKTADHAKLAAAEDMAARGVPREQIWNDTGWFQGADKKWRFEIDDSNAGFNLPGSTFGEMRDSMGWGDHRIKDAYEHPELYNAYPLIGNYGLEQLPKTSGYGGQFIHSNVEVNPTLPMDEANSVMLHELQHGVEDAENFAKGGNGGSGYAKRIYNELAGKVQDALAEQLANGVPIKQAVAAVEPMKQQLKSLFSMSDYDAYHRTSGEVEARTVQKRMDLTPEERASRPPWLDYDVPESQQIVRLGGSGPQMSVGEGTPWWKMWGSKTPDAVGNPMTFRAYHGMNGDLIGGAFDPKRFGSQWGGKNDSVGPFFSTSPVEARAWADMAADKGVGAAPNIVPADINLRNPYVVHTHNDSPSSYWVDNAKDIRKSMRGGGHDGVVLHGDNRTTIIPTARGTVTSPLTGETLFSDTTRSSLPGTILNGAEHDRPHIIAELKKLGLLGTLGMGGASLSPFDIYGPSQE